MHLWLRGVVVRSSISVIVLAASSGAAWPTGAQADRTLAVTLYTAVVHCRTAAGATATVQLIRDGTVVAEGGGEAGSDGWATIRLDAASGPPASVVLPRDVLRIDERGASRDVAVPDLRVDTDADADRIFGAAPAGAVVQVSVTSPEGSSEQAEVTAGPDDRFAWSLAATYDVRPGDTGSVRIDLAGGYRFTLPFAVRRLDLTLWQPVAQVLDVPGAAYEFALRLPGAASEQTAALPVLSAKSRLQLVASGAIEAGTIITMTRRGPLRDGALSTSFTVPRLSVAVDTKDGRLSGDGPPSTDLAVQVTPRNRLRRVPPWATRATTDDHGAFSITLPTDLSLSEGGLVSVTHAPRPDVHVSAVKAVVALRTQLFGTRLDGIIVPGAPLRALLRSPDGATKSMASGVASDDGYFLVDFGGSLYGTHFENVLPGDMIELDWSWGDPVLVPVPAFSVRADVAGDRVFGTAPPGTTVTVTTAASDTADDLALRGEVRTVVTTEGRFSATFAGVTDITRRATPEPGESNGGLVFVRTQTGDVFYTS